MLPHLHTSADAGPGPAVLLNGVLVAAECHAPGLRGGSMPEDVRPRWLRYIFPAQRLTRLCALRLCQHFKSPLCSTTSLVRRLPDKRIPPAISLHDLSGGTHCRHPPAGST